MATRRSLRNKLKLDHKEIPVNNNNNIMVKVVKDDVDNDDGSSSDSSVGNYLRNAEEIDLNSSFFSIKGENDTSTSINKRSYIGRISDFSDSDLDELECEDQKNVEENPQSVKNEVSEVSGFQSLHNFNKKLEEAKLAVQNYNSKKEEMKFEEEIKPSKTSMKKIEKQTRVEIKNLLSVGEKTLPNIAINNQDNFMTDSSEGEMDWEDVEQSTCEPVAKIPKEGVEVTVTFPTNIRQKKSKDDVMASMKRKINRIKKENQVFMHKVHLLCYVAHGNFLNSVLNSENLLGVSLSLLPSENCYPPKHADLKYLEQITKWYKHAVKIIEKSDNEETNLALEEALNLQLINKETDSKKNFVLIYICILRALGLNCRLILSLQCVPIRPPNSELCSLSTKNDKEMITKSKSDAKKFSKTNENKKKIDADKSMLKNKPVDTKKDTKLSKLNKDNKPSRSTSKEENQLKSSKDIKASSSTSKRESKMKINQDNKSNISKLESKSKVKGTKNEKYEGTKQVSRNSTSPKSQASTSKENKTESKYFKENNDKSSPRPKRSRLSLNYKSSNDSEEDFKPQKSISSAEKSKSNEKKRTLDVRLDVINLIKGDMVKIKHAEKQKLIKSKQIMKEESDDSDYLPEQPVDVKRRSSIRKDSESDFKPKKTSMKLASKKTKVDNRALSTDSDEQVVNKKQVKNGIDIWAEVFLEAEEKWISVDVIKGQVHCVSELYSRATTPVCYVLSWNNNRSIKDVTARYCPHMNTTTRKLRVDKQWWHETLKPYLGKKTARDREEDEDLARQQLDQPLPKIISEYKNHPLYALKRHLLKFEAIYPPDSVTLGFVRNEPVYARECVYVLHSREIWLKDAKTVKLGEQAYKIVKARPKYDRLTGQIITDKPLEIFGPWQVEDYVPPTAENGVVPRNAFGNVELFKPCMLPKGTVHLQLPGLNKVSRKLRIDCAPALTGFEYHSGGCHPNYDGFVVCEEFKDTLIAAWEQEQEEAYEREVKKIEKRVYDNWRKFIKGLLIRERLKVKYEFTTPDKIKSKSKKGKGPCLVPKKRRVVSDNESD